ncbi:MAG: TAXI family TRAP transporter solute-binding subunit [Candidatus Accumulibacter sp.]|jgi:TRAP transporter TAXI family solute receptor|nr:TAXI family TRAP transporter solute-binding subunit [Accumulibacter sp.]
MTSILGLAIFAIATHVTAADQLFLLTGSTGGTYFALGGAIGTTWNKHLAGKVQVTTQPSGASVENLKRMGKGEAHLGLVMNNIADQAWKGEGDSFKDTGAIKNFRAIGVVYPEVYQGFVAADSPANSIADLKDKRVAIGPVGSGTAVISKDIFAEYGLQFSDFKPEYAGFGDAASKFKDGHIDANFGVLSVPAAAIQDVATVRKIKLIEIKGAEFDKLQAKYPFFSQYTIPAGTYGNDKDALTINMQAALYCKADLKDDLVYELTKTFYEKADEIGTAHAAGKSISLQKALDGITTTLHPGAVKYFKEKGIQIPDEILPK